MNSISILIVEDNPLDAELVLAQLRHEQIPHDALRVTSAKELREALEGDRSFDVILSDFSLPSFSGSEALEMAKQIRPGVPFIFVSGALGEEVAIELLKKGATDYVLKHRLERLARQCAGRCPKPRNGADAKLLRESSGKASRGTTSRGSFAPVCLGNEQRRAGDIR